MKLNTIIATASGLEHQLTQLGDLLRYRIQDFTNQLAIDEEPPIEIAKDLVSKLGYSNCGKEEYVVLLMALAPHIRPSFFDEVIQKALPEAGDFPQLGGVRGKQFRGFLPTGETALFILGGDDLEKRFEIQELFSEDHFFAKKRLIWLEEPPSGEPKMSGKIFLSSEYLDLLTLGKVSKPKFGLNFPAQRITTTLLWEDLVLSVATKKQIKDLENWIQHGDTVLYDWGMRAGLRSEWCHR